MDAVTVTASWGAGSRRTIAGPSDLDAVISVAAAEARDRDLPINVELQRAASDGTLSFVVGADRSVLNHVPADNDPPYLTSVGDDHADREFAYSVADGHFSETTWRHTVPSSAAREAAGYFMETGRLTSRIIWEEV